MKDNTPQIVDSFGRIHDYLRISLTERCNLRCFYCMPEDGIELRDKKEFMSTEELLLISKKFVDLGVKKIRLTGGEPTIRKDFSNIIRELGKLPVELGITTNAVIIDKYIEDLKAAGVKSINVSLDSLKEDRFNAISRRSYYSKIRENIDLLIANDFKVKVNVVVIKGTNDDEVIDFVQWSMNEKIQIRFIEFMPFDGNNWNWEKKVSYKEILEKVVDYFGEENFEKIQDGPNDTTRNFRLKGAIGTFGIISSVTNPFCDTCNRIRLTADGKLKNCLFSQSETDLLSALRAGELIEPMILKNCWNKAKERGGYASFETTEIPRFKNRSMVAIGG
jgi:molybdenum cofactor biosynthesis protein A